MESKSNSARLTFVTILLGLTLLAYFVPYYDWDLVAYTGAVIALHERNPAAIQSEAYAALQRELPEDDYDEIVNGSAFRRDVAGNPNHFSQQLRFYQIRPLYISLLALFRNSGMGYVRATRVLSAVALFLLGLLLFTWAGRYVDDWRAAIGISLLVITPVLFTSGRTGSPDAISALAVTLGAYIAFEQRRLLLAIALLLLSLFLRTDNAIFVFLLLTAMAINENRLRTRLFLGTIALMGVVIVFAINGTEHSYSWKTLMQNTSNPIVNPAEVTPSFTTRDYFSAAHDMIDEGRESSVVVFLFIAGLALFSPRLTREWKQLLKIVLLSWAAHIVLFPHIEDRYFVAGAAIIGVAALAALPLPKPSGTATLG